MSSPKVAIGMPVYNGDRWLAESLDSALAQSFEDFELIISDNASTDNTSDICREYASIDPRIRYHRNEKNVGVYRNFDLVFELTSSEYFKWWTVGDLCDSRFLERCVDILDQRSDVVLVHSRTVLMDERYDEEVEYDECLNLVSDHPAERFRKFLERSWLNNSMHGVVRSDALRKTDMNRAYMCSDLVIYAELALGGKFFEIPERLWFRREQIGTSSARRTAAELKQFFAHEPADMSMFQTWKFEVGLMRVIMRSSIDIRAKMDLLKYVFRRIYWKRSELFMELASIVRRPRNKTIDKKISS